MRKTLPELACNTCVYSDSLHCDAKCERKASGLYDLVRDICLRCFRVREVHTGGCSPPHELAQSTVLSVASTLRSVVRLTPSAHMASHTLRSEDNRVSLFECKHQQHRNSSMSHESATRPRRSCKYVPFESHATPTSVPNGRAPCDMWSRG